jgi:anhydro-N-acetylmuramic acid kinase
MHAGHCYLGLMSGTSLDGVDAVLVDLEGQPRLLGSLHRPFAASLRTEALALHTAGQDELRRAAELSRDLAETYAQAVIDLLAQARTSPQTVAAIGCHGQTVRHCPSEGYSIQLNNPALLAERTGIAVVADFRSRDIAAGGQGAPLVPAFHARCFGHTSLNRVVVNIGGIANITRLPAASAEGSTFLGFDTGPGNMLLDAWIGRQNGSAFDDGGAFAASGKVNEGLLARFLSDAYFSAPPPKSTGRDRFNMEWLLGHRIEAYRVADVQATLAELTARSIAGAISGYCPESEEIYVCGGGAHNTHLMARISACLPGRRVDTTQALGIAPGWVEAMAFAWLAQQTMEGQPGNLPSATGAKGPRVLGAVYPA